MTSGVLSTGQVYQEPPTPDLGEIWSDGSDATFTVQYGDNGPLVPGGDFPDYAGAVLQPYTAGGPVTEATIHARLSATRADGLPDPVRAQFDVVSPIDPADPTGGGATYAYSTPDFDIPADGVIRDLDVVVDAPDWAEFRTAMETSPAIELYFDHWGGSIGIPNRVINVYEVSLAVGTVGGVLKTKVSMSGATEVERWQTWGIPNETAGAGKVLALSGWHVADNAATTRSGRLKIKNDDGDWQHVSWMRALAAGFAWGNGDYLNFDTSPVTDSFGDSILSDQGYGDIPLAGTVRVGDKVLAVYEDAGTLAPGGYTNCRVKARFVDVDYGSLTFTFGTPVTLFDTGVEWSDYKGHAYWFMQLLPIGDYVVYSSLMTHTSFFGTYTVLLLIDCSGSVPVFKHKVVISSPFNYAVLGRTGPTAFIAYNPTGGTTMQLIPYTIVSDALVQGTIVTVAGDGSMASVTSTTDGTFMGTGNEGELIVGTANPTTGAITSATHSGTVAELPSGDSGWDWWTNTSFNIAPVPGYPHAFIADNGEGDLFIANNNAGVYEVPEIYVETYGADYRWAFSAGRGTAVSFDSTGMAWAVYSSSFGSSGEQYHLVRDVFGTPTEVAFDEGNFSGMSAFFLPRSENFDRSTFTLSFTPEDVGILVIATAGGEDVATPYGKWPIGCFRAGEFS